MAAPAGPAAPPAGAGGSGGAEILQQIEALLAQLAQSEPEPEIQQAVTQMSKQAEALQQVVGKSDEQDMQSGLANPGGAPGMGGAPGAEPELPGAGGGAPAPPEGDGGGEHHVVEVHIGVPGGAKSFKGANKAAMAHFADKGHFGSEPKGETPQTERTKNKAKG
jgi:hypothetical protein